MTFVRLMRSVQNLLDVEIVLESRVNHSLTVRHLLSVWVDVTCLCRSCYHLAPSVWRPSPRKCTENYCSNPHTPPPAAGR